MKNLFILFIVGVVLLFACSQNTANEGVEISVGKAMPVPSEQPVANSQDDVMPGSSAQGTEDTTGVQELIVEVDPNAVQIEIKGFAFNPLTIKVKKGTTVTWTNQDTVKHNVAFDSGSDVVGPLLAKGESYSFSFDKVGTYDYHCSPHPKMIGKVIVE